MKIIDVWFSKPHLFATVGHWRCRSFSPDEWIAVGLGDTPQEAFADMRRVIDGRYGRITSTRDDKWT